MKYIACFGDSLIQGFPFGSSFSWINYACEKGQTQLLNYGVCGDCCDDIYGRMRQTSLPDYVKHIIFLGGANDMLQRRPVPVIMEDIGRMFSWCSCKKLSLCIVLPFISGDAEFNSRLIRLRELLKAEYDDKLLLLDLQPAIGFTEEELRNAYLDGVHPKAAVHQAMGTYARTILTQWVSK